MLFNKIRPFHDPRAQLRSAHLNGRTYGYFFGAATSSPIRGTVELVHGFPDVSFLWRYQIPFLSDLGLNVIAIDCIEYGRTDTPVHTLIKYSFRRAADDIELLYR